MNAQPLSDITDLTSGASPVLLERVELLCAVHALAVGSSEISPQSLALAEVALESWRAHGAFQLVKNLSKQLPRDALIKGLVQALTGLETVPAHGRMLRRTLDDLAKHAGSQLMAATQSLQAEMHQHTRDLLRDFDPAKEIGEACGQTIKMRFIVRPLLFLPLPPDGRHGVITIARDGWKEIHMFFGVSLGRPISEVGITPRWLQRGGWHYAIREVIDECRVAIGANSRPLGEGHQALLRALPAYVGRSMESVFLSHLSMAIRWVPWRLNLRRELFILLAKSQGLLLVEWFVTRLEAYLQSDRSRGIPLARTVPAMFEAFLDCDDELSALAQRPWPRVPPIISCALLPLWASGSHLVVPDEWLREDSYLLARAQKAASDLRMILCGHEAWRSEEEIRATPAILYGSADEPNLSVVLEQNGIVVREHYVVFNGKRWEGGNYTVASILEGLGGSSCLPWRVCVCNQDASNPIVPSADRLLRLPYTAVLLKDDIVVDGIRSNAIASELVDLT